MLILVLQATALVVLARLLRTPPEPIPQEIREESGQNTRRRR